MTKVDFKRLLNDLYNPPRRFVVVNVPEMQFLMADGHGDPNVSREYQEVVEALYAVAYKLKFMSKKEMNKDYVVPPLEGLWWANDMDKFTVSRDKSEWDWTMMIMTPEWISNENFTNAAEQVRKAKDPAGLDSIRLEKYHEGLAIQILHIGSYDDEGPILAKMHQEFIPENGLSMHGKHHEIYLSDPRRVAAEKLKTILRQPVKSL